MQFASALVGIVLPRPFVQWQLSLSCKSLCGSSTHQEVSPTDAQGALSKGSLRRAGTKERNQEDLSLPERGMKEAWWSHHEEDHILNTRLCGHLLHYLPHLSICVRAMRSGCIFPFLIYICCLSHLDIERPVLGLVGVCWSGMQVALPYILPRLILTHSSHFSSELLFYSAETGLVTNLAQLHPSLDHQ